MGVMENSAFSREMNSSPTYKVRGYKPVKEEMEIMTNAGQQVQSTLLIMPEDPPVRDYAVWSFFNIIYMNFCCLGLIALVFSIKSRDRSIMGDKNGARTFGAIARSLNIAATIITVLLAVIMTIIFLVNMKALQP